MTRPVLRLTLAATLTSAALAVAGIGAARAATTPCDRHCVVAAVSAYLDAEQHTVAPSAVPLDPEAARYQHGTAPAHRPGGADAIRRQLAASNATSIGDRQWVVDGTSAFVAYTGTSKSVTKFFESDRFTLRNGLIWEIMTTPEQDGSPGAATPNPPVTADVGPAPPAYSGNGPNYDNPAFCSDWIGTHGDASLTPAQHRRCMIAIATTYINAEDNSAPGSQILFDPRVARYSEGAAPDHEPGNADAIRLQEGTVTRVIRQITDRRWTVEGDNAWIDYDGYLVISTTHPGFYVAERITIRNGLIWEIMITPVTEQVP